jgi:hypothetical protein
MEATIGSGLALMKNTTTSSCEALFTGKWFVPTSLGKLAQAVWNR